MKKTSISSRPSSFSASSGHINKSRNVTVKTRVAGSSSNITLDFKGASSRNASAIGLSTLDTQTPTGVKDRLLQKCQQELEQLKRENSELKAELLFIRSLYKQLVEEVPLEKFDERRVNLLKSQVIQLERQVLLQSSALQARRNVFLQVENKLLNLIETLRSLYSSDDSSNYITVSREYIQNLEYKVEGARLDLYKSKENAESDDLSLPAIFMGDFLKQSKSDDDKSTTLLDCCSGKVEHLNLKHVTRLESKLCKLYKNMVCLKEMLQHQPSSTSTVLTSEHISQPIRDRLASHVTIVTDMLRDCSEDLLSLSVLYPAAAWPPLKKVIREDLTEENIMSHMPDLSRKKQQEMSAEKKARSARFTQEMSDALVQAYGKNQYILQGKFSDSVSNDKKQDAWKEVVNSVNAVNPGEKKNSSQVKRRWEDLTGAVKKKGREARNKELIRLRVTGNGHLEDEDDGDFSKPCTEALNPFEQQIAKILGPQTFTGIPGGHDSLDTLVPNKAETDKGNKNKAMEADVQEVSVTDGNNCSAATVTIKDSKPVGLAKSHLGQKRRRPAKTIAEAQLEHITERKWKSWN